MLQCFSEDRCTTPNGDTGRCISVYSCQTLLNVVRSRDSEQIRFLRESQCGYSSNPLVCCGRYSNFQRQQTTNTWGNNRGSDEDDRISYGNDDNRGNNNNNRDRNNNRDNNNNNNRGGNTNNNNQNVNNGRRNDLLPNKTVCGRQVSKSKYETILNCLLMLNSMMF